MIVLYKRYIVLYSVKQKMQMYINCFLHLFLEIYY